MMPLHKLDIAGLHAAFASGETNPAAVTEYYFDRIAQHNSALCAFVELDLAGAMAGAAESVARIAAGAIRPLEGVPIGIKANIGVAGMEWHAGMQARRGIFIDDDADAVARLRNAGAIILGTLNMHEAALGATTANPWFGTTINPHREGYTAGGSSGGSGAAVSAGLCLGSLGTDTLGSVRIPAAYTGVYGIKPTNGLISDNRLLPLSYWLDSIGPLARSLADLKAILAVLIDQSAMETPVINRLVVLDNFDDIACEPGVLAAYQRTRALIDDLPNSSFTLADDAAAVRFASFVIATRELNVKLMHIRAQKPDQFSEELNFMLDYANQRTQEEVEHAEAVLMRTRAAVHQAIGKDGVMLLPTTPQAAFAHSARPPVSQSAFTAFASIAGLPAISIPAGVDENGMPVAIQLVGPERSESALFELAERLDAQLAGFVPSLLI